MILYYIIFVFVFWYYTKYMIQLELKPPQCFCTAAFLCFFVPCCFSCFYTSFRTQIFDNHEWNYNKNHLLLPWNWEIIFVFVLNLIFGTTGRKGTETSHNLFKYYELDCFPWFAGSTPVILFNLFEFILHVMFYFIFCSSNQNLNHWIICKQKLQNNFFCVDILYPESYLLIFRYRCMFDFSILLTKSR